MKKIIKILLSLLLLFTSVDGFSQEFEDVKLIYSYNEMDQHINYYFDTVYIEKTDNYDITFFDNSFFYNDKELVRLDSVEYYLGIYLLECNSRKYLYIYPKYFDLFGPYMWYELGYLVEFNPEKIIIKSNCDFYDPYETFGIFRRKDMKIEKEISIE